jgi:citrate synthase
MIVNQTEIAKSKSDGPLIYRGYDIRNLVRNTKFKEVAFLVQRISSPRNMECVLLDVR